ncbi:MAG: dockerin type I repeat-containing protein [Muribaculaceae bacterium]|nr:dockerin type I repeat-containing protein [Muribaculaceae bacterium]
MQRWGFLLACALLVTCSMAAQEVIALFNRSNYEGWTYVNNAGIELNAQNIGRGRITLLTTEQGNVQELISPRLDCAGVDSLGLQVEYAVDATNYSKVTIRIDVNDDAGQSLSSVTMKAVKGEPLQQLATVIPATGIGQCQLRFSAPDADVNNCGSVMAVSVLAYRSTVTGDVDGDGKVDVSDVNAVINIILGVTTDGQLRTRADVDGDGKVDVSDVNHIINTILKVG